jgi:hypothetical protein
LKVVDVPADRRHLELYSGKKTMRVAQRCHCEPPAARPQKDDSLSSLEAKHGSS